MFTKKLQRLENFMPKDQSICRSSNFRNAFLSSFHLWKKELGRSSFLTKGTAVPFCVPFCVPFKNNFVFIKFTSTHNLRKQVMYWLKTRVRKISEKITSIFKTVLFNILLSFSLFPKPKAVKKERGAHSFLRYQEHVPAFVPFVNKREHLFLVPQKKERIPRNAFLEHTYNRNVFTWAPILWQHRFFVHRILTRSQHWFL